MSPRSKIFSAQMGHLYLSALCLVTMGNDDVLKNSMKAWGLPDVTAISGQAFIYNLPPRQGQEKYLVSESDLSFLPGWIEFDSENGRLLGVPDSEHIGRSYLFQVRITDEPSTLDSFRVEVRDSARMEDEEEPRDPAIGSDGTPLRHRHQSHGTILCKKSKSRTSASVVVDVSSGDPGFSARARFNLLDSFARYYDLPLEALRLVGTSGDGDPFDGSALVAGPGDVVPALGLHGSPPADAPHRAGDDRHLVVRWIVGCGSVHNGHMTVLQRVEKEAVDGTLHRALGHGIIGWYVTNQKPRDRRRRNPRGGAFPTPTPTISAMPPTAMTSYPPPRVISMSSGEEDEVEAGKGVEGPVEGSVATPVLPATLSSASEAPTKESPPTATTKPRQRTQKARKQSSTTRAPKELLPSPSPFVEFAGAKSFGLLEVQAGEIFLLEVGPDFFTGPPSGLEVLTTAGVELNADSWIRLSPGSPGSQPHLYGLPLLNHEGLQDYLLRATDMSGSIADIRLRFKVARTREPLLFEANAVFGNLDYDRFMSDVDVRMNLTRSIASCFGDGPPSDIVMTRVERGSVDYWWTNQSLERHSSACPEATLRSIQERVIEPSGFRVSPTFLDAVEGLGLTYIEFQPRGHCERAGLGFFRAKSIRGSRVTPKVRIILNSTSIPVVVYERPTGRGRSDEAGPSLQETSAPDRNLAVESSQEAELLKQIVIPVLIVVALVLLSAVVACLVCRRRDSKHPKSSDSTELVSKGAPVIFAHELGEAPPPGLSPRALVPPGGGRSPRPPNYHRRAQGPGYSDFYASEGLMAGQSRYVSS